MAHGNWKQQLRFGSAGSRFSFLKDREVSLCNLEDNRDLV